MSDSPAAQVFREKLFRLAAFVMPVAGTASSLALLITGGRSDHLVSRVALVILIVTFAVSGIVVVVLRRRYKDILSERRMLQEQVRLVQEKTHSLRTQVDVLAAMRELGRIVSDDVDSRRILHQVLEVLENLLAPEEICVVVKEQDTGLFVPRAVRRRGKTIFDGINALEDEQRLFDKAIADRTLQKQTLYGKATLVCPLIVDREVAGAIKFAVNVEGGVPGGERKLADTELIINNISRHIALAIKTPNLHDRAIIDGLTGLYSRTHFENQLREHTNAARRYHKALSLIMADIDHFKWVNDVYGHLAGDTTLGDVASAIKANVRDCDSVYRYGGEEFAVILPETSAHMSQNIAERLRRTIQQATVTAGEHTIRVAVSLGVAELGRGSLPYDDLVSRADAALLAAKKDGRNRTFVWHRGRPHPVGAHEAHAPGPEVHREDT